MPSPHVLRFDRSDEKDSFVLVHLVHHDSPSLNLTLTATEGEAAYTTSIKEKSLKDLRAKTYQGSDNEWSRIIRFILGQSTTGTTDDPSWSMGIEATAKITESDEKSEIVITIRKRVQDITQRLGSFILKQSEDEIELFEWAGTAAATSRALENQVATLTSRYQVAEDTVQKLNQQLEELLQAKTEHESQLMANFTGLLNEKKLEIRNQRRLLDSAAVDPDRVSEIQANTKQSQDSNSPRPKKRTHTSDEDSEMDFEPMDIDRKNSKEDGKSKSKSTPDETDTDEGGPSTPLHDEGNHTTTDDESEQGEGEEAPQKAGQKQDSEVKRPSKGSEEAPPPRRELPFTRRGAGRKVETPPVGDEMGGETDDDEL